jgi:hypothetical protein
MASVLPPWLREFFPLKVRGIACCLLRRELPPKLSILKPKKTRYLLTGRIQTKQRNGLTTYKSI